MVLGKVTISAQENQFSTVFTAESPVVNVMNFVSASTADQAASTIAIYDSLADALPSK